MLLREQLNFNLLHSDLQNLPPTVSSECMAIKIHLSYNDMITS